LASPQEEAVKSALSLSTRESTTLPESYEYGIGMREGVADADTVTDTVTEAVVQAVLEIEAEIVAELVTVGVME